MPQPTIHFSRLTQIPAETIIAHMSDPKVATHLPLLRGRFDRAAYESFLAAKEACWTRDGLGHWAILVDGTYAGWGGFQKEGDEWDLGLVLCPDKFGMGGPITRKLIDEAKSDPRIPFVTFLLPPSRRALGWLRRLGAYPQGEVSHDGERFLKYRLDTV